MVSRNLSTRHSPGWAEPMAERSEPDNENRLFGFVGALRSAGLTVPLGSELLFVEALGELSDGVLSVYWAGRATLTHDRRSIDLYDSVFSTWWLESSSERVTEAEQKPVSIAIDDDDCSSADSADSQDDVEPVLRFSRTETLRSRDFAGLTTEERLEVDQLMESMDLAGVRRRSRRRRPSDSLRGRPDLRRTIRESLRTGGEPFRRRSQVRVSVPRRVILLCDISGSMAEYSRSLVRFAHVAVADTSRVEVFTIGTRLTRLTRELATLDPDDALNRAAAAVPDWDGGTRLGESMQRFNDDWGVRGMARGAIVVILSDGWDRGDTDVLAEQMARLQRVAFRTVWVNPLKASEGYAPLAKGMAAALPFVDDFIEGHSLESLDELGRIVSSLGVRRPMQEMSR